MNTIIIIITEIVAGLVVVNMIWFMVNLFMIRLSPKKLFTGVAIVATLLTLIM